MSQRWSQERKRGSQGYNGGAIKERIQTIAFVKARVVAELLYRYVQEDSAEVWPFFGQLHQSI